MAKDFLLELGSEEIPASFIQPALEDLERNLLAGLKAAGLSHGIAKRFGTPRRIALLLSDVVEKTEDLKREVLGPSVRAAFDADGKPTKAAEKFAESVQLPVSALRRVTSPKGEYLAATVEEKGKTAPEILKAVLPQVVHSIGFKKSMRWGDVEHTFARPLHWIVALLGEEVLPVVFADVRSGRTTYGHRFLSPGAIELRTPSEYVPALKRAQVVPDVAERKELLLSKIREAAAKAGGQLVEDDALVDQVVNLVELPCPVVGRFEERHLDLPPEVLVSEMKSHQRYFSLKSATGKLLPRFIAVSNTPVKDENLSLRGYQRVLAARLSDGRFFFDEDRRAPLESRVEKLSKVTYQQQLGSTLEKVERFKTLAKDIAARLDKKDLVPTLERAAILCKADLVTGMVGEFPELQGVMGREYAHSSGEKPEVATAIFEHYLPRTASDALPTTDAGAILGLADRFDTLCGIFGVGKPPTGAADPFALRRACLAIVNVILAREYRLSLPETVAQALSLLQPKISQVKAKAGDPPVQSQVLEFFRGRLKALWSETARTDLVEAVLSAGYDDLVAAQKRLKAMAKIVGQPDFAPLAIAFKRVVNIVEKQGKDVSAGQVDVAHLQDPAEKALHQAYSEAKAEVEGRIQGDDFAGALKSIVSLKPTVDTFFDKVMVMAEDRALRENRIRLLTAIGGLFGKIADFSKIQVETESNR